MSRRKDQEDAFIKDCKVRFGSMTWETEIMARYGFAAGYDAAYEHARRSGREAKRQEICHAITCEETTIP